jgi:uncharacterized membrane protein affecting hemolysin expression
MKTQTAIKEKAVKQAMRNSYRLLLLIVLVGLISCGEMIRTKRTKEIQRKTA